MARHPQIIKQLIDHFAALPSIGPKTAERLVFYLLKQTDTQLNSFAQALSLLKQNVTVCQNCFIFSENSPCSICQDQRRNKTLLCVVEKPQDTMAIEKTDNFDGVYHVLGGTIDPLEGITPDTLTINQLVSRIKKDNVSEVVLALSSNMSGETTMLYLTKLLKGQFSIKITRLAQGLPSGSDLEYADEVTLSSAFRGRKEL
jgi:recombination protein RecR